MIEVLGGIRKADEYDVPVVGTSFDGKQLFVALGVPKRKEIELFIHSQGGKTTATYTKAATYFIGTKLNGAAKSASVHSRLLKPSWIDKIRTEGTWVEPEDEDYLWKP